MSDSLQLKSSQALLTSLTEQVLGEIFANELAWLGV